MRLILVFFFSASLSFGQSDSVTVLSWNVFLRPAILKDDQMHRVDSIAAFLDTSDADVLVLQEVFHRRARKRLCSILDSTYTYKTARGPVSFWGVPSGVLVFSKYPITEHRFKPFKRATGSDRMARKSVVRTEIEVNGKPLEIYGTHMQAGGGGKRKRIRQNQLNAIQTFALNGNDSVPQIFAGDFNISAESSAKDSITEKLEVELPEVSGKHRFTANFRDQQLMSGSGSPKWIDFILLKGRGSARCVYTEIKEPRMKVAGKSKRISDHNPIVSTIELNEKISCFPVGWCHQVHQ